MNDNNKAAILAELSQFYGSDKYYTNPMYKQMVYTTGVRYMAEHIGAYWLLDMIAFDFLPKLLRPETKDRFYTIRLTVKPDGDARVIVTNGNDDKPIISREVDYTDFPVVKDFKLFLCETVVAEGERYMLMLPDEY